LSTNQPSLAKAWSVVIAGVGTNLCLGVLYTWSVFKASLLKLGWSNVETQFPYTLACLIFAACMIPGGRMVDRIGPRWVVTLGALFVGAGMILSSATMSVAGVTIGFGILVGAAMGFGYAAPTPAAIRWFKPHKKGLIAGLVVGGFGGASIYTAPLTTYLANQYQLKGAFLIEGIIFMVTMVILAQFLSVPPTGYVPYGGDPPATKAATAAVSKKDYTPGEMLKTPQFYLLWLMFLFGASAGLMIIGHLATIGVTQSTDPKTVASGYILVATLAIANAGGRVVFGALSDKLGRTNTMLMVFCLQAANMFLFHHYKDGTTLLLGSILTGASYGACLSVFPSTTFDFYGMKNGGLNYSLVFSAWGCAALIGPIYAGKVADTTKALFGRPDYTEAYIVSGILMVFAAVLALVTKPPKTVTNTTSLRSEAKA